MLLNIHVKNMALIQEADIDLSEGLNILTGETGAGKSIIIGSVNVALGAKSFKGFMREDADYALVELVFSVENEEQLDRLRAFDIPLDDSQVIISRKQMNGRSISKVNGETVPVTVIRQIAEILIDIHGQHEHQSLLYRKNHLQILDEFAGEAIRPAKEKNASLYRTYTELKGKLESVSLDETARKKEMDFLQYEIGEIEEADLRKGEDEELESRYRKLSNSRKIMEALAEVSSLCGYDGAGDMTGRAMRSLTGVTGYDTELEELANQLGDIENLLNDFNRELASYLDNLTFDEEDFRKMEERLDLINHLKSKYGASIEDIFAYRQEKEDRLSELENYEIHRQKLQREYESCEKELMANAAEITEIRKKYAAELAEVIRQALVDLNFLEVAFEIAFEQTQQITAGGMDEICFMISTNPGAAVRPLGDVASGGELSRIMLAIKTVLADKDAVGTLIFDEIDVGISGRTAQKVSEKLSVIAGSHQVICITHLAQIAAMADSHYVIEKQVENQVTVTRIRRLSENESVEELARILGGAEITDTVMQSAREMKELAVRTKA